MKNKIKKLLEKKFNKSFNKKDYLIVYNADLPYDSDEIISIYSNINNAIFEITLKKFPIKITMETSEIEINSFDELKNLISDVNERSKIEDIEEDESDITIEIVSEEESNFEEDDSIICLTRKDFEELFKEVQPNVITIFGSEFDWCEIAFIGSLKENEKEIKKFFKKRFKKISSKLE